MPRMRDHMRGFWVVLAVIIIAAFAVGFLAPKVATAQYTPCCTDKACQSYGFCGTEAGVETNCHQTSGECWTEPCGDCPVE